MSANARMTDRARKVIQLAISEATLMAAPYAGSIHVLVSLIEEGQGVAAGVLRRSGLDSKTLREMIKDVNQQGGGLPSYGLICADIINLAEAQRVKLGHNYLGTEHLLLAVLCAEDEMLNTVLAKTGVNKAEIINEVYFLLGHTDKCSPNFFLPEHLRLQIEERGKAWKLSDPLEVIHRLLSGGDSLKQAS